MKGKLRKDRVVIVSVIIIVLILATIFATQFIVNNDDTGSMTVGESEQTDTEKADDTQQTDDQQDADTDSSSSEKVVNEINITQDKAEEIVKDAQKDDPNVNVVESEQRQTTDRNYYIVYSDVVNEDGTHSLKSSYVDAETGEIIYEVEE